MAVVIGPSRRVVRTIMLALPTVFPYDRSDKRAKSVRTQQWEGSQCSIRHSSSHSGRRRCWSE
ncbi:hypothetical protein [Azospirillum argentinense]